MSRDDNDLAAAINMSTGPSSSKVGGLTSRLRRALSLDAAQSLSEEKRAPFSASEGAGEAGPSKERVSIGQSSSQTALVDGPSIPTSKKKSRAASLFNSRLNASTDNISLSSTVSSASVMIRKIGAMSNLARRNSLAGITSLFKDKKSKGEDGKGKKKKDGKGSVVEASVSHATAELDRSSDYTASGEMSGLTEAAKLARHHTLRSNAEAAAKTPAVWENNTVTRAKAAPASFKGKDDGTRLLTDEEDLGSEDDTDDPGNNMGDWDDEDDWGQSAEDEDVTIRANPEQMASIIEENLGEAWSNAPQTKLERPRAPKKGILKSRMLPFLPRSYSSRNRCRRL